MKEAPGSREKAGVASDISVISSSFLGRRAEQLSTLIEHQFIPIFKNLGIVVPVRSCSLLHALAELEAASAADLANRLGQSHQLVLQKIPALTRLKLLDRQTDPDDKRRKLFRLTPAGEEQVALLTQHEALFEKAYADLNAEIGVDIYQVLGQAIEALQNRGLDERISEVESG